MSHPLGRLVRQFYQARERNDPQSLRIWLAPAVRWCEPEVGTHMGMIEGADGVIDMITRALATTAGSFRLQVIQTVETATHCSAVIAWSAQKAGRPITGQELAVFGFQDGLITEAYFFPANIANDEAFWD